MFVAELVDPDEEFHLLNSASGVLNDVRSYVAPFGAIKFHDSSRARLKRLEVVYERVVALFEPVNEVVILAHGGSFRVWLDKYIAQPVRKLHGSASASAKAKCMTPAWFVTSIWSLRVSLTAAKKMPWSLGGEPDQGKSPCLTVIC